MTISTQSMLYVVAVAQHLNFRRAAEHCFTSQPNLSMQIKAVEDTLGFTLFERSQRFVKLTSQGEKAMPIFRSILKQVDQLKHLADDEEQLQLSVGIFPSLAPYYLPELMQRVLSHSPNLKLRFVEDKTARIVSLLEEGCLDCILAATPIDSKQLDYQSLFTEDFYVALSKKNCLAKKETLCLEDIKHERVLLLEDGHCLRDQSLEICQNASLNIDDAYQSASLETLRAMVAGNWGISFFPEVSIQNEDLICFRPLSDLNMKREIALFWRRSDSENNAIRELKRALV